MPLCKLLIILCGFYMKNNNSYTAHFVPVSLYYINFHLRQHLTQFFFLSMLSSTAYGRNIIPPHICYSIIVHKCSLHHKNMRLCEVKTIFEGNLVFLYKIYTVSKKMCVEGFHTDRFFLLRTPFCIEILPHKQG